MILVLLSLAWVVLSGPEGCLASHDAGWTVAARRLQLPQIPLHFEANAGQIDPAYSYVAYGLGYRVALSGTETLVDVWSRKTRQSSRIRVKLVDAASHATPVALSPLPGRVNYFTGNDPNKWITDIPTYERVRFRGVYPGADMVFYGTEGQLEYDFVLAPGANPGRIQFDFDGADEVRANAEGDLEVRAGENMLTWKRPAIYQETAAGRTRIDGRYNPAGARRVGFAVGDYDRSKPLVIDPVVGFASYIGGSDSETAYKMTVDGGGNTYLVGVTYDINFPTTPGTFRTPPGFAGLGDMIISKFNATGTALVYSTHIGSANADWGFGAAVDAGGNLYIAGTSQGPDYPTTNGALRTQYAGGQAVFPTMGDCVVTKLNPAGNALVYSTYLGGSGTDSCMAIAVDATGAAYLTGVAGAGSFPTTDDALQRTFRGGPGQDYLAGGDAFVAKLNPAGSALVYSTFFGGAAEDMGMAIAVDGGGNAYVTGFTLSNLALPLSPNALQRTFGGAGGQDLVTFGDAFVLKLNPQGTAAVYATYLGGRQDDIGHAIAVDRAGNAYVAGATLSNNFPTTPGALLSAFAGRSSAGPFIWNSGDAFVAKLNPEGTSLTYSTLLGGNFDDRAMGIAVDDAGNAWVAGNTLSTDFPVSSDALQRTYRGADLNDSFQTGDGFIAQLNPAGAALLFSTYFGGAGNDWVTSISRDASGSIYVAGGTSSRDLPVTPGAFQNNGGAGTKTRSELGDAFIAKLVDGPPASNVSIAGVANAASYAAPGIAPGEMVIVTGTSVGPPTLAGAALNAQGLVATAVAETRILFDDTPAPIVYVSAAQSAAVVPYAMAGRQSARVVVEYRGARSAPVVVPVVAAVPGLFSANSSGRGPGAISNQDGSFNSAGNPAAPGSVIVLYGTGEGQTDPAGVDGRIAATVFPKPVLPVTVTIGGRTADVLYAGAMPSQVAGLFQVNAKVPEDVSAGDHAVVVRVGSNGSQAGLTVAVR